MGPEIIWIIIAAVLLIVEATTTNLVTIWFALGALVALIASMIGATPFVQFAVWVIASVIILICTRPAAIRLMKKTPADINSVTGKTAVVTKQIDNIKGVGEVKLDGKLWSARNAENDELINETTIVIVEEIQGVKLMVKVK